MISVQIDNIFGGGLLQFNLKAQGPLNEAEYFGFRTEPSLGLYLDHFSFES